MRMQAEAGPGLLTRQQADFVAWEFALKETLDRAAPFGNGRTPWATRLHARRRRGTLGCMRRVHPEALVVLSLALAWVACTAEPSAPAMDSAMGDDASADAAPEAAQDVQPDGQPDAGDATDPRFAALEARFLRR